MNPVPYRPVLLAEPSAYSSQAAVPATAVCALPGHGRLSGEKLLVNVRDIRNNCLKHRNLTPFQADMFNPQ